MKYVGNALSDLADADTDFSHKDLLGRSAFNRFYYASFLCTRKMLGELNPDWKGTAHKNIPTLLRTSIKKDVRNALRGLEHSGAISKSKSSQELSELTKTIGELAELLESSYSARILADYEPEILVTIDGKVIKLDMHKLTTASSWPDKTNAYCKIIFRIWRDAGLG